MPQSIVLTSADALSDQSVSSACQAIERSSQTVGSQRRLAGEAVAITFYGPADVALEAVRSALGADPIDANLGVDGAKRLLICDMDSTIIGCECIDEIAAVAGVGERVAAITERAMRGEIDFEGALRERVGLLAGLDATLLEQIYSERVHLNAGAAELVSGMKTAGALCALVSGGFEFFTKRVSQAVGFDRQQANKLEVLDGKLTGRPTPPILGQQAKLDALNELVAEMDASPSDAVAVGDGANDLAMIRAAGLGVAYRAKPVVAAEADARLDYSDLTAVLRLQGIPAPGFT